MNMPPPPPGGPLIGELTYKHIIYITGEKYAEITTTLKPDNILQ